jgi:hypothetical protein
MRKKPDIAQAFENSDSRMSEREKTGRFRSGYSGNPAGRPKGSRNKLGEEFIAALYADFVTNGEAAIERVRLEKPDQYLKVIAAIVPKELAIAANPLDDVTDAELADMLQHIRGALASNSKTRSSH